MFTRLYGLPHITVSDAARLQQAGGADIFDCNPHRVWAKHHVPGARNIDPADYTAADLPTDHDRTLIFYCSDPMCGAGPHAARRARRFGYRNVLVMSDGIKGWLNAQLETEPCLAQSLDSLAAR